MNVKNYRSRIFPCWLALPILVASLFTCWSTAVLGQYRYARKLAVGPNTTFTGTFFPSDGDSYMLRMTTSAGGTLHLGYCLVRLDRMGSLVWTKDIAADTTAVLSIVPVAGRAPTNGVEYLQYISPGFDPSYALWALVRVDSNGSVRSTRMLPLAFESVAEVRRLDDGKYVLVGSRHDQSRNTTAAFVSVMDTVGRPIWMRMLVLPKSSTSFYSRFDGLVTTSDGSVICYGQQSVIGVSTSSAIIARFGPDGVYHDALRSIDSGWSGFFTCGASLSSGGLAIGGYTLSPNGQENATIRVFDPTLRLRYSRTLDFLGNDAAMRIIPDSTGGFTLLSATAFLPTSSDPVVVTGVTRFDSVGTGALSKALSIGEQGGMVPQDAFRTNEGILVVGSILAAGVSQGPGFLVQLDGHDSSCLSSFLSYSVDTVGTLVPFTPDIDSTVFDGLLSTPAHILLHDRPWADSVLCLEQDKPTDTIPPEPSTSVWRLYPNPCIREIQRLFIEMPPQSVTPTTHLVVRSAFGRVLFDRVVRPADAVGPMEIHTVGLAAGTYVVEIYDGSSSSARWRSGFVLE